MSEDGVTCPNCGSSNIVEIIYGMPTREAFLEEKAGKIKLGGCVVQPHSPDKFCKDCEFEWLAGDVYAGLQGIEVWVGGHFGHNYTININLIDGSLRWSSSQHDCKQTAKKEISHCEVAELTESIRCIDPIGWKEEYVDPGTLDGTSWSVTIWINDLELTRTGANAFPDNWESFCEIMSSASGVNFR